jgi:hypothetical protein
MKSRKMFEKTNSEKFFTPPESPQTSDVNRHAKDSEDKMTTMLGCRHLNAIDDLTKQFANNFTLLASKEKNGQKCTTMHKEKIMTNGVVLIVLSDKGIKDVTSYSEEEENEMPIMTDKDIQEFKDT